MMRSHIGRTAAVIATAWLASGCAKLPIPGQPAAGSATMAAPTTYDVVFVPGSPQVNPGVIRINVATGQTVTAWGAPAQMVAVPDLPLPIGQYHLTLWSQPAASDGSVAWGVSRLERGSGRIWILSGGGQTPYNWIELTPPR